MATTEEVYNISKIYSKLRKNEMSMANIATLAETAINSRDYNAVEKLSNIIFARADEQTKQDFANKLCKKGFLDMVPLHYKKGIKPPELAKE